MFRVVTNITIRQEPTADFPNRTKVLFFDFCNSYECEDTWNTLTDTATVVFPKNIYVRDENGKLVALGGTNKNIGGFSTIPLFLRGDRITIASGYKYFDNTGTEKTDVSVLFEGFIASVRSKMPIELQCEDNMWKLKQLPAPSKVWPAKTYTLEKILKEMLVDTPFTVNVLTNTTFGDFRTQNETVAEVLARLRKDYHFESYFRGTELRSGSKVYIDSEAVTHVFEFQKNIIEDELDYQRRDDVRLSAVAYSVNKIELQETTKKGKVKTKTERLSCLVIFRNGRFETVRKQKGVDFPANTGGERRTLYFWDVQTVEKLAELATDELQKYYYTGLKGKFVTFGIPFVKMGDNVLIRDPILPERNGLYRVKSVGYNGPMGLRQEITLDYRISG